jgi:hypothetical protein
MQRQAYILPWNLERNGRATAFVLQLVLGYQSPFQLVFPRLR